ncbi:MAG: phosphonate C-P lyase system protein PhnL [Rhodobiaceae bacterium]|nr:phosphonate C-P lyase system protein PhnL [Rhodobiaceae bacterium]MCC0057374.1 phosphonate C-P lyase system protein PhnL [Rhodobiaceae bacterium]
MQERLRISGLDKTFTLHLQGGTVIPVMKDANLSVSEGECVALAGPSGAGKSSLLRMIYANYRANAGEILIREQDTMTNIVTADPRKIIELRRSTIGYVSQFLRVIPRVSAIDIVAEPAVVQGRAGDDARDAARALLARLNLPERLWALPPATFSGGEQQRVNIARGFLSSYDLLLLDEPTASLDAANRRVVMDMIGEKKAAGVAIVAIFHDEEVRDAIADRVVDVTDFTDAERVA